MNNIDLYENYPLYYGDKVRYNNFLKDLKDLMTIESSKYTLDDFMSYVLQRYELLRADYFNILGCYLLSYTLSTYYKKFLKQYEDKDLNGGNKEEDMSLLRSVKGL